jgi:hypothetical protein
MFPENNQKWLKITQPGDILHILPETVLFRYVLNFLESVAYRLQAM